MRRSDICFNLTFVGSAFVYIVQAVWARWGLTARVDGVVQVSRCDGKGLRFVSMNDIPLSQGYPIEPLSILACTIWFLQVMLSSHFQASASRCLSASPSIDGYLFKSHFEAWPDDWKLTLGRSLVVRTRSQ